MSLLFFSPTYTQPPLTYSNTPSQPLTMLFKGLSALAIAGLAVADATCPGGVENKYTATGAAAVAAAQATAKTTSPTSNVKGKAFDRIAIIYFENQNYDKSVGDGAF